MCALFMLGGWEKWGGASNFCIAQKEEVSNFFLNWPAPNRASQKVWVFSMERVGVVTFVGEKGEVGNFGPMKRGGRK